MFTDSGLRATLAVALPLLAAGSTVKVRFGVYGSPVVAVDYAS